MIRDLKDAFMEPEFNASNINNIGIGWACLFRRKQRAELGWVHFRLLQEPVFVF